MKLPLVLPILLLGIKVAHSGKKDDDSAISDPDDKLCDDPNDKVCIFCSTFARPGYQIEAFPGLEAFRMDVVRYTNEQFLKIAEPVVARVTERVEELMNDFHSTLGRLESIILYVRNKELMPKSLLSTNIYYSVACILQNAKLYATAIKEFANEANVMDIRDLQDGFQYYMANLTAMTRLTLGDMIGELNCRLMFHNIEAICRPYRTREMVMKHKTIIGDISTQTKIVINDVDQKLRTYDRLSRSAAEQRYMMCT